MLPEVPVIPVQPVVRVRSVRSCAQVVVPAALAVRPQASPAHPAQQVAGLQAVLVAAQARNLRGQTARILCLVSAAAVVAAVVEHKAQTAAVSRPEPSTVEPEHKGLSQRTMLRVLLERKSQAVPPSRAASVEAHRTTLQVAAVVAAAVARKVRVPSAARAVQAVHTVAAVAAVALVPALLARAAQVARVLSSSSLTLPDQIGDSVGWHSNRQSTQLRHSGRSRRAGRTRGRWLTRRVGCAGFARQRHRSAGTARRERRAWRAR